MARSARDIAVEALMLWEREHTYSNIMLDNLLQRERLSKTEAALATRLIYGVIERCLTIDWMLQKNSRQPLRKCDATVLAVLRVATYQLLYMKKIPPSAAVNEAVGQAKRMKKAHAAGFVNGVLRSVQTESERLLRSLPTDLKGMSVRHSVPTALLKMWDKAYGRETALALAAAANEVPPSIVRVNTLKTTIAAFEAVLCENGIGFDAADLPDGAYRVSDGAALRASTIAADWYYFQDAASQWACYALGAQPGERILDVCAAPGGKTFTTVMYMNNDGAVVSCDVYEEKTAVIASRAMALGATCVTAQCRDASAPLPAEWEGAFDRVICDVPCSGYGVIRRRPEIRYKDPTEFCELPALQYAILCEAAKAVKAGGVLQYSTCTLRPEENEQTAAQFLAEHAAFAPRELPLPTLFEAANLPPSHQLTLMPHIHGTDGFFVASFQKEESL